jgi:hypothetical protein
MPKNPLPLSTIVTGRIGEVVLCVRHAETPNRTILGTFRTLKHQASLLLLKDHIRLG